MKNQTREELEAQLEELKDRLYDLDRAIIDRVGLTGKPSAEGKKARSAVIRDINRTRRQLYQLAAGGPKKTLRLDMSRDDYQRLRQEAQAEGLPLKAFALRKLLE